MTVIEAQARGREAEEAGKKGKPEKDSFFMQVARHMDNLEALKEAWLRGWRESREFGE